MKSGAEQAISWLDRWGLIINGPEIRSANGLVLPVVRDGVPLVLKIASHQEEARGNALMEWWGGQGSAQVLARHGAAILMAKGQGDLTQMPDETALPILCGAVDHLHQTHAGRPLPKVLTPLDVWLAPLTAQSQDSDVFFGAAAAARSLLKHTDNQVVLHGDIHHGNVLKFVDGWKVIDPKALLGPRGFDYANMFPNPDPAALTRALLLSRLDQISALSGIPQRELASWVLVWLALSCRFNEMDGHIKASRRAYAMARLALSVQAEIGQSCG